ncbi:MAG TPA: hypothetical protein VL461_14885 [Dictyobacter sp.]|nr:hypothetical protein [Dictyobacter sp.]
MLRVPPLLSRLDELPLARVYLVAGPAASGKTTFSTLLASQRDAVVLSMDNYFIDEDAIVLEHDELYGLAPQWESPDAYDMRTLQRNVQELFTTGEALIPVYSFAENRRVGYQPLTLRQHQHLIIEGLYTVRYRSFFAAYADELVSVFVVAEQMVRDARARQRDMTERGKPAAEFEKRRHFSHLGEQRWGLVQEQQADFVLRTDTLAYQYFCDIPTII